MKLLLKSRLNYYLISIFCLLISFSSIASHVAGLDLIYKHDSGNKYKVTVFLYRDCSGIQAASTMQLFATAATNNRYKTFTLSKTNDSSLISFACNGALTKCQGGSQPGIYKLKYEAIVDLGSQEKDWRLSVSINARNTVTSINGQVNCSVTATLNNKDFSNNNSPNFGNDLVSFLCQGQSFTYNHGATDIDGDVLSYAFTTPKLGINPNDNITYNSGYSVNSPLGANSSVSINSSTGSITVSPSSILTGVVAIEVTEKRNGVVVGSVVRDMQLWINSCSNNLPTLTGVNNTNNYSATAIVGQQLCFDIFSQDIDASQNLTLSWNSGIAGASFTQTAGAPAPGTRPIGKFCWTPATTNVGVNTFTVTVQDNACPLNGIQIYTFTIIVNANDPCNPPKCPNGVKYVYAPIISSGVVPINQQITFTNTSGCTGAATYLWEIKNLSTGVAVTYTTQNPSHTFTSGGNYSVKLSITISGCISSTVKLIRVSEQLPCENCIGSFAPEPGKYILSAWVKEANAPPSKLTYSEAEIKVYFPTSTTNMGTAKYTCLPSGAIIDGWQRIEHEIEILQTDKYINLELNAKSVNCYFDDIRIHPKDGSMVSYVYDPNTLRLMAELDERNYATLYEYDEEGKLIRVKKETEKGIMTIKENKNSTKKQ